MALSDVIGVDDTPSTAVGMGEIVNWYEGRGGATKLSEMRFIQLFDFQTPCEDVFTLRAKASVTVWMLVHPANLVDDRIAIGGLGGAVSFEHIHSNSSVVRLPEPFGAVRDEFTVPRGTAKAYSVEAGEVIQIIDVAGQQCSDFMSMNARALEQGQERYVDSTVTRSMVRGAYPAQCSVQTIRYQSASSVAGY